MLSDRQIHLTTDVCTELLQRDASISTTDTDRFRASLRTLLRSTELMSVVIDGDGDSDPIVSRALAKAKIDGTRLQGSAQIVFKDKDTISVFTREVPRWKSRSV